MFFLSERTSGAHVEHDRVCDYAARLSVTTGRWRRFVWKLTVAANRCPGLPPTSADGFAQGELRGQAGRGSILGLRLAGKRLS